MSSIEAFVIASKPAAHFGAGAIEGDVQRSLRRAAHWSFVAAATLAVSAACLGTLVAAYRTFGDG